MSAAELRERRRAKILMSSEERMKKLMGTSQKSDDKCDTLETRKDEVEENLSCCTKTEDGCTGHNMSALSSNSSEQPKFRQKSAVKEESKVEQGPKTEHDCEEKKLPVFSSNDQPSVFPSVTGLDDENAAETQKNEKSSSFSSPLYTLLMLLAGILVRVAITSRFSLYVQTVVYPFVALQVSIYGTRHVLGIDVFGGRSLKGGIWISLLHLSGIDQHLIESYGQIMGCIYSTLDDFAVYLFAFIVTHILL